MDEAEFYQSFTTSISNAPSRTAIRGNVFPMEMGRKLLLPQNFRVRISYRFLSMPIGGVYGTHCSPQKEGHCYI